MRLFAVLGAGLLAACSGHLENQVQAYKDSRLDTLLAEYEAARTSARWLDACTRAGQIAAAYRETGSPNQHAWETRRQADCQIALETIMPPPAD